MARNVRSGPGSPIAAFASPKSSTFTRPAAVSLMLAGFKSRRSRRQTLRERAAKSQDQASLGPNSAAMDVN
jgi:hypothetical protein